MRLTVALAVLAACAHGQHDAQLDQRLTAIEQRLDAQQRAIDEARQHNSDVELTALAAQIEALRTEIAGLHTAKKPPRHPEPDRTQVYAVPVDHAPIIGLPTAKVTLVMAGDFACPYCRKAWGTVEDLRKKYGPDLRVAYKEYVVHPQVATIAAQAACAAGHQGKFHEMAELLWTDAFDKHHFERTDIDAIAKKAKLDMKRYAADIDGSCPSEVTADGAEMTKLGVGATPSFFINGRFLVGALPIDEFEKLIDEEMVKADAAIKSGVKADDYYATQIVGKGLTQLAAP